MQPVTEALRHINPSLPVFNPDVQNSKRDKKFPLSKFIGLIETSEGGTGYFRSGHFNPSSRWGYRVGDGVEVIQGE